MPHLTFYAFADDRRAVLDAMFDMGAFAVYEMHGESNGGVRRLERSDEVPLPTHGPHLVLHAVAAGGIPTRVGTMTSGLGLIQLSFGGFFADRELRWSVSDHGSAARARQWADVHPSAGEPDAWDFDEIRRTSARLNRRIRSLGVDQVGTSPVLPAAANLMKRRGLTHVYGTGVHVDPPPG